MESNNWDLVSFGKISSHSAFGPRFSSKEYSNDGNIACLRTKDISVNGVISFDTMPLAILDYKKFKNHFLQENDLVITRTGRIGTTAIFTKYRIPVVPGAFLIRFRLNEEIAYPLFYRYFLNSRIGQNLISSVATGSVQQNLNITNLNTILVPLPPLPIQKEIAHILGSLDDKIALNRRMNETLEQMAQALFKSWFVDFDPVIDKALAAGHAIPEPLQARAARREALGEQRKALPGEVAGLFPDGFVWDEEMGWIPEGWEVGKLSKMARLDTSSVKPYDFPEKLWEHFSIPAFDKGEFQEVNSGLEIKSNKYRVLENSILVSKLNPDTQRIWYPNVTNSQNSICSTEFMQFIPFEKSNRPFLYYLFKSRPFKETILSTVTGSTGSRQRAKPKTVATSRIISPDKSLVSHFSILTEEFLNHKTNNILQIRSLSNLRDTLLPKLISGELSVSEAAARIDESL